MSDFQDWIYKHLPIAVIIFGIIGFIMVAGNIYANIGATSTDGAYDLGSNAFSGVPVFGYDLDAILVSVGVPVGLFEKGTDILYLFIAPMLVVLLLFNAIFKEVLGKIFTGSKNIHSYLAILFTLILLPTGVITTFIYVLVSLGSFAVLYFAIVGILFLAAGWAKHKLYHPGKAWVGGKLDKSIQNVEGQLEKIRSNIEQDGLVLGASRSELTNVRKTMADIVNIPDINDRTKASIHILKAQASIIMGLCHYLPEDASKKTKEKTVKDAKTMSDKSLEPAVWYNLGELEKIAQDIQRSIMEESKKEEINSQKIQREMSNEVIDSMGA